MGDYEVCTLVYMESKGGIPFIDNLSILLLRRKMVGGQFMWGAVPLKQYQRRPKTDSRWIETICRVQKQKSV